MADARQVVPLKLGVQVVVVVAGGTGVETVGGTETPQKQTQAARAVEGNSSNQHRTTNIRSPV
jgi:hypothetical protein